MPRGKIFRIFHKSDPQTTLMTETRQEHEVLQAFYRTTDLESFVLKESPELAFPQLYNRLKWLAEDNELLRGKLESRTKAN